MCTLLTWRKFYSNYLNLFLSLCKIAEQNMNGSHLDEGYNGIIHSLNNGSAGFINSIATLTRQQRVAEQPDGWSGFQLINCNAFFQMTTNQIFVRNFEIALTLLAMGSSVFISLLSHSIHVYPFRLEKKKTIFIFFMLFVSIKGKLYDP